MISIGDYDKIMERDMFNRVIYTPLSEAIKILEERQKDLNLVAKIEKLINGDIPLVFKNNRCGVMARQIVTPNYDVRSFISITLDNDFKPVFYEYLDDQFVPENEYKNSLGKLIIHKKIDKNGNFIEERISVVDFKKFGGKKLKDVETIWGEPLTDFHRKLFNAYNIDLNKICFLNRSDWVKCNGKKASEYYSRLFLFFICHGILFENFMITNSEGAFTKEVILPAFEKVYNETGLKPLIVPIPPMDMEDDIHWLSHDSVVKKLLINK